MGYFSWYVGEYGFFQLLKKFFFKPVANKFVITFFYWMGISIGKFFFDRYVLIHATPYLKKA